ncbi:MAG: hypothetical protein ACP5NS_04245 [Candidatus Pacearchaeota archaeon]
MKIRISLILLVSIWLFGSVYAFGMTPAKIIGEYSPGVSNTYSFEVVNTDNADSDFVILVSGELNESISPDAVSFSMLASESSKTVSFKFNSPTKLKPGQHSADINVLQIPKSSSPKGTVVNSIIGLTLRFNVDVPYPGKYAEATMNVADNAGSVSFVMPVSNKGDLDISRAKALVDVYTPLNEKVISLSTNEVEITRGGWAELSATWDTNTVPSGRYRAVAAILYDEETTTVEKEFSVGSTLLDLKHVEVNDFTLGGIAKFEFLVESVWSEVIPGAYIQMQVFNEAGEAMADFKSATYDIVPFENKLLVSFWDTEGVRTGTYDATAFVRFGQQSLQHDFKLEVSDNDITVVGIGYVIKERNGKSDGSSSLTIILITAVSILVLLNLVWFLLLRKKLKSKS